jgi:hypothetical protein
MQQGMPRLRCRDETEAGRSRGRGKRMPRLPVRQGPAMNASPARLRRGRARGWSCSRAAQGSGREDRATSLTRAAQACEKSSRARTKITNAQQYASAGSRRVRTVGLESAAGICLFGNDTVCLAGESPTLSISRLPSFSLLCGLWSSAPVVVGC